MVQPEKYLRSGASGETRTLTLLPEPDFESGASTSSATEAGVVPSLHLACYANKLIYTQFLKCFLRAAHL